MTTRGVWIIVVVTCIVVLCFALRISRGRCKYLNVYRKLTGDTRSPPLPTSVLEEAAVVEYSIKLRKGKHCQTRRLFVEIDDRDTFLNHVSSQKLRDWVGQKPTQQTYMMGKDGDKMKVYWTYPSEGPTEGGQSYDSFGETREYKVTPMDTFPLSLSILSPYLTQQSSTVRYTPGHEKQKVYYIRFRRGGNVKIDAQFRRDVCTYAQREGYSDQDVQNLASWLEKAHRLRMAPSWLQVQPNEQMTVYTRLPEHIF